MYGFDGSKVSVGLLKAFATVAGIVLKSPGPRSRIMGLPSSRILSMSLRAFVNTVERE